MRGSSCSLTVIFASVDFGLVVVGEVSSPAVFQVVSTGEVNMPSVTTSGDFVIASDGCEELELIEGQICEVEVQYTPTTEGPGAVELDVNGVTAAVTGTGLATGDLVVSPASIDFGSVEVGQLSPAQTLTVQNDGGATITNIVPSLSDATNFTIGTNDCTDLAAGASCAGSVVFAPVATGTANVTRLVSSDGGFETAASVGGNALQRTTRSMSLSSRTASRKCFQTPATSTALMVLATAATTSARDQRHAHCDRWHP